MQQISSQKKRRGRNEQQNIAYLFILFPVVLLIGFGILPIVMALYFSFTDYNIIEPANWLGLANFQKIFHDEFFFISLKNTMVYTFLYVPLGLVVSLGTALLLNKKRKSTTLFRTFFYLPVLCSTVATATIWYWLLNPQYGLLNQLLRLVGIDGPAWLYSSNWAMTAIVIMSVWMTFGGNMMIFLAGLQGINPVLYEAADMEGANSWQKFSRITWPQLSKTTFLVTTQLIIGAFQVFDQAYMLTKGGPGNSTITLVYYIYNKGFGGLEMGYASALSFILFLIIFVFSLINMKLTNKEIH
ncbi:sugar ABC transporter permease [Enterococcus villorum]|uniref:Sugar ABC transporter permease n=1 Tax=Enterococcus villorum TaxID=112904 RepID=A0A1V8YMD6_9ENTE|nr:sugar ABC transporter permease [Enterococcus villorum]OQO68200.1 sugar ABC transporter permease [Enterococcus villorum]OQO73774.1 sugar ABC transporter permease [Enterococcus villorum]